MQRSNRFLLLAGIAAAILFLVLVVVLIHGALHRGPERIELTRGEGPEPTASEPATRTRPEPPTARRSVPEPPSRPEIPPPGTRDVPPPPIEALPARAQRPAPPPEKPKTPAWRLKMTRRLVGVMEKRVTRLKTQIAAARREGNEARAHRQAVILRRTRMRLDKLAQDVALYSRQVAAEPAMAPARSAPRSGEQDTSPREGGTHDTEGAADAGAPVTLDAAAPEHAPERAPGGP